MKDALPTWVSVDLRNFWRNIHGGLRDCYWASNLSKPPRGGLKAVVWDGCLKECLAKEVKKIDDAFDEWKKLLTPKQDDEDGRSELTKAIADLGLPADETGPATTFANIRREIQDQASTYKSHWFTLMPVPQAAPDAIRLVQGSGAWQNTQADSRVAIIYALSAAYDREPCESWRGDRQYSMPLWDEDFSVFSRTIDELVTKDNKNYAVILLGPQGHRQSCSLNSQYGIATEQKNLRILKDIETERKKKMLAHTVLDTARPGWRRKRVPLVFNEDEAIAAKKIEKSRAAYARKGISAVKLTEPAMFLWRGQWPNALRITGRQDNGLPQGVHPDLHV